MLLKLSIKNKIWLGYGLVCTILGVVGINLLLSQDVVRQSVVTVIKDVQPTVINAWKLSNHLHKTAASLGYYLLSKETQHKQAYLDNHKAAENDIKFLMSLSSQWGNKEINDLLIKIKTDMQIFTETRDTLFALALDNFKNFPAMEQSRLHLNPISLDMLQLSSEMLDEEYGSKSGSRLSSTANAFEQPQIHTEILQNLNRLRDAWFHIMLEYRGFLSYRLPGSIENIKLYKNQVQELIGNLELQQTSLNFEQILALEQIDKNYKKYFSMLQEIISLHNSDKWRTDVYLFDSKINAALKKIDDDLNQLLNKLNVTISQTNQNIMHSMDSHVTLGILLSAGGIILSLLIAYFISTSITRKLDRAVHAMNEVSGTNGNLSHRLEEEGNDEISQLSAGFNIFVSKIEGLVNLVVESSTALASEAFTLTDITRQTKEGAVRQQSDTVQVDASVHEMSAMLDEVTRYAKMTADAATQSHNEASSGKKIVSGSISSINELATEVNKASDQIQAIEQDSKNIEDVLLVIGEITEQTNLLALNAAIEAARAGDQGRGFAVVADEVRALAIKTRQGTQDIQGKINQLRSGINDAVNIMSNGREKALISVEQASKAGEAFELISQSVSTITEMNANIAQSTEYKNDVSNKVNTNISNIKNIAEKTAESAVKTSSSSHELSIMAGQLRGLVEKFLSGSASSPCSQHNETVTENSSDVELF